jgi:hypothetical protein
MVELAGSIVLAIVIVGTPWSILQMPRKLLALLETTGTKLDFVHVSATEQKASSCLDLPHGVWKFVASFPTHSDCFSSKIGALDCAVEISDQVPWRKSRHQRELPATFGFLNSLLRKSRI